MVALEQSEPVAVIFAAPKNKIPVSLNSAYPTIFNSERRPFMKRLCEAASNKSAGDWFLSMAFRASILILLTGFFLQQLPLQQDSQNSSTAWCQENAGANDASDGSEESGWDEIAQIDFLSQSGNNSTSLQASVGLHTKGDFTAKTISVCTGPCTPPPEDQA